MKLFGEFLIEKKVITAEILADALIAQVSTLPTTSEIVRKEKLLSADQIVQIFKHQFQTDLDFESASRDLGLLTDEIEKKINDYLDSKRVPIGQILLKTGVTDLTTLTKMLDEFLSTVTPASNTPATKLKKTELQKATAALDPNIKSELEAHFTDSKKEEQVNLLSLVKQNLDNAELIREFMSDFSRSCHSLAGMTKFLNLNELSELLGKIDSLSQNILSGKYDDTAVLNRKLDLMMKGFEVAWKYKLDLVNGELNNAVSTGLAQISKELSE